MVRLMVKKTQVGLYKMLGQRLYILQIIEAGVHTTFWTKSNHIRLVNQPM